MSGAGVGASMIPKIIHHCWFGRGEMPAMAQHCVRSWRTHCPEWELRLWNEDTFDVDAQPFTASAYRARQFAFVSDYVRAWALHEHGGVYLDTDVELKQSLNPFLVHEAFSGFELPGFPFTAVWGAQPKHRLSERVLHRYAEMTWSVGEPPNTTWIADLIANEYGIDRDHDRLQVGSDGTDTIHIYPSTHFCLDLPVNVATHHFLGSWVPREDGDASCKASLNGDYHWNAFARHRESNHVRAVAERLTVAQAAQVLLYRIRFWLRARLKS